jgi:hypothetical protein
MKHQAHGQYENEVEKPHVPSHGHQEGGMGLDSFKKEAAPIAYGQAGVEGCKSDMRKIEGQMKHYYWEGTSEY